MSRVDPVDRAALLKQLPQICDELNGCSAPYDFDEHCLGCEVYMLHGLLTDAPTIESEPVKRGEWVDKSTEWGDDLRCTACGESANKFIGSAEEAYYVRDPNYCPNCGAYMKEEEHDGDQ